MNVTGLGISVEKGVDRQLRDALLVHQNDTEKARWLVKKDPNTFSQNRSMNRCDTCTTALLQGNSSLKLHDLIHDRPLIDNRPCDSTPGVS